VPDCYEFVQAKITEELNNHPFRLGVDETTDSAGHRVANILIGQLDNEKYHVPHLLGPLFLEDGIAKAVARAVNDCLRSYWPNLNAKQFKVMHSDAAAAMIKAGKDLQIFYPEMLSFTSLAHAIHRLCEEVETAMRTSMT